MLYHNQPLPIQEAPDIDQVFGIERERATDIVCDLADSLARQLNQPDVRVTLPGLLRESTLNLETPAELMLASSVAAGMVIQVTGFQYILHDEQEPALTQEENAQH